MRAVGGRAVVVPDDADLRATALHCATRLVTGMARASEEGATFNDRDDVLGYADHFLAFLRGEEQQ